MVFKSALFGLLALSIQGLIGCTGYTLPTDLSPLSYKIHLDIGLDPDQPCHFSGKVWINLKCLNDTENVVFNAKKMILNKEAVSVKKLGEDPASRSVLDEEYKILKIVEIRSGKNHSGRKGGKRKDAARIKLDKPLTAGSMYQLYVEYNGTMNSKRTMGIYCSSYSINREPKWLWSASFEPHLARTAFPSWDEPQYKAIFNISISHPNHTSAISNAPLASSTPLEEGVTLSEFEPSPLMSSYLVSFLVSEFHSQFSNDLKHLAVWAPSKQGLVKAHRPLAFAVAHLRFLEEYTNIPDPTPKQDMITIPNYIAGGLENWGIISFDYKTVLLDKSSSRLRVMLSCDLVAHELAHIYFGNLVTPASWNHIWLSEGFANYYAIAAVNKFESGWNYEELSTTGDIVNAYESDSLPSTRPLVPDPAQDYSMYDLFDDISYRKGSLMVRMLKYILGEDTLRDGVRSYLKKRSYGSATSEDLWECLQYAADERGVELPAPLSEIMSGWMSNPGHPIVSVTRNYTSGLMNITQRSVLKHSQDGRQGKSSWWIPLTYTYGFESDFDNTTIQHWLSPDEEVLVLPDPAEPQDWVIFNKQATGFYRVEYDKVNMDLLVNDLLEGNADIPLYNKILLIQDSLFLGLKLARSGQPTRSGPANKPARPLLAQSLDLFDSFRKERSESMWLALLASLHNLYYPLKSSNLGQQFKEYLKSVVGDEMRMVSEGAAHTETLIRWACLLEVPECTTRALRLFNSTIPDFNNTELEEEMRYSVYCEGIRQGDEETWKLLFNRLTSTLDKGEASDIARALACTSRQHSLKMYVSWLSGEGRDLVPGKVRVDILKTVSRNEPDLMLELLSTVQRLNKQFSGKKVRINKLLETLASSLTDQPQLEKLQEIIDDPASLTRFSGHKDEITWIAESNIAWAKTGYSQVRDWLQERNQASK